MPSVSLDEPSPGETAPSGLMPEAGSRTSCGTSRDDVDGVRAPPDVDLPGGTPGRLFPLSYSKKATASLRYLASASAPLGAEVWTRISMFSKDGMPGDDGCSWAVLGTPGSFTFSSVSVSTGSDTDLPSSSPSPPPRKLSEDPSSAPPSGLLASLSGYSSSPASSSSALRS
jgi:hypothetical protein